MQEFPSTQAKDQWGAITEAALQSPVTITRHGRPSLIVTSIKDYEELQSIKYEQLKDDVKAGFEALDRGEGETINSREEMSKFMAGVKMRGARAFNKGNQ